MTLVYEGEMSSLKHEKEDVREVRTGSNVASGEKNFHDIEVGDELVCYVLKNQHRF